MTRQIIIDEDTEFGYYFPKKSFYIRNKNTETLRTSPVSAKRVLDIVAPNNSITLEDIIALSETYETVSSLSYTWADDGSYISTIQFNDYAENPLVLDAPKQKLYIMNTNIIYDLTLTEGKRYRLDYIQAYYKNNLGLDIVLTDLSILYDLLISLYKSHVYNKIETPTETPRELKLKYSSELALADYIKLSPAEYSVINNPLNKFNPETIGSIKEMRGNTITLTNPIPSYNKGSVIVVEGSAQTIDGTSYSNDGEYTVVEHEGNTIIVKENFPTSYSFPYFTSYIVAYSIKVTSANREEKTITTTNIVPDTILVGDTIRLKGTVIETEYETLTIDGDYTVESIEGNTIRVLEDIPTNYTYEEGTEPIVYKRLFLGNILGWKGFTVTLDTEIPETVKSGTYITLTSDRDYIFTISSVSGNTMTVTATPQPNPYNPNYPKVQEKIPYPEMLVRVSSSNNTEELPTGDFILDNKEEANEYLKVLPKLVLPTEDNYNNIGRYVKETMYVGTSTVEEMKLMGLYSEIYRDKIK